MAETSRHSPGPAVITLVHGRTEHLRRQQRGLSGGRLVPTTYVVVALDDPEAARLTVDGPMARRCSVQTVVLGADELVGGLPLARARNLGAERAISAGADTLIFLDVDCIPTPNLVSRYAAAVAAETAPALHCGVVRYLMPGAVDLLPAFGPLDPSILTAAPHPARPAPIEGSHPSADWPLFWSLSFAISSDSWQRLGGFHQGYRGYGGEDTDFGYAAHRAGVDLSWTGGADAYHQYHPSASPPVGHLVDIVRNANLFQRRWGFFPMQGWLSAFAEGGLAHHDVASGQWRVGPS